MLALHSENRYCLYRKSTDMRKSFDGLCGIVESELKRSATSGEVFIFINKRKDRIKLLKWQEGGFELYYKRLEQGTFELPKASGSARSSAVVWPDLVMMIEGIPLVSDRKKRKRFRPQKQP